MLKNYLKTAFRNMYRHLSYSMTNIIGLAIVLAIPLAFITMHSWLNNFAFKIDIGPWMFAISCIVGLAIAWLTVSWQSFKTALVNPIESLKSE